jgi:hypothetical protein
MLTYWRILGQKASWNGAGRSAIYNGVGKRAKMAGAMAARGITGEGMGEVGSGAVAMNGQH